MKKKKMVIISLVIVLCFITGCDDKEDNNVSPDILAKQQSEAIIKAVVNEDKEALKKMFCQHIKDTHDLEQEINDFLNSIDGEVVSYDEPKGSYSSGVRDENGVTEVELMGEIRNIETDSKKCILLDLIHTKSMKKIKIM